MSASTRKIRIIEHISLDGVIQAPAVQKRKDGVPSEDDPRKDRSRWATHLMFD